MINQLFTTKITASRVSKNSKCLFYTNFIKKVTSVTLFYLSISTHTNYPFKPALLLLKKQKMLELLITFTNGPYFLQPIVYLLKS